MGALATESETSNLVKRQKMFENMFMEDFAEYHEEQRTTLFKNNHQKWLNWKYRNKLSDSEKGYSHETVLFTY